MKDEGVKKRREEKRREKKQKTEWEVRALI
jgi:hypothetical protein